MLVAPGAPHGVAVAASLLQRAGDKGLATIYGLAAYVVARRRLHLHEVTVVRHGQRRMRRTPPRWSCHAGCRKASSRTA